MGPSNFVHKDFANTFEKPQLSEKAKIEVWVAPVPPGSALSLRFLKLLDKDEVSRMRTMGVNRNSYLISRALLRRALSNLNPAKSPKDWRFKRSESGQWKLMHHDVESINLSTAHSKGIAAVAVSSDTKLGVDVELVSTKGAKHLDSAFTPHERVEMDSTLKTIRHWTAKEAVTKLSSLGADLNPQSFEVLGSSFQVIYPQSKSIGCDAVMIESKEINLGAQHFSLSIAAEIKGSFPEVSFQKVAIPDDGEFECIN